jgi:hypothetical protein
MLLVAVHGARDLVSAQVAQPLNIDAADSARVSWLHQHGRRLQSRRVVLWYPPDSLPEAQAESLLAQLDRAVPALQQALDGPYPWQRLGKSRVE